MPSLVRRCNKHRPCKRCLIQQPNHDRGGERNVTTTGRCRYLCVKGPLLSMGDACQEWSIESVTMQYSISWADDGRNTNYEKVFHTIIDFFDMAQGKKIIVKWKKQLMDLQNDWPVYKKQELHQAKYSCGVRTACVLFKVYSTYYKIRYNYVSNIIIVVMRINYLY
jgi:hypothetical protein